MNLQEQFNKFKHEDLYSNVSKQVCMQHLNLGLKIYEQLEKHERDLEGNALTPDEVILVRKGLEHIKTSIQLIEN